MSEDGVAEGGEDVGEWDGAGLVAGDAAVGEAGDEVADVDLGAGVEPGSDVGEPQVDGLDGHERLDEGDELVDGGAGGGGGVLDVGAPGGVEGGLVAGVGEVAGDAAQDDVEGGDVLGGLAAVGGELVAVQGRGLGGLAGAAGDGVGVAVGVRGVLVELDVGEVTLVGVGLLSSTVNWSNDARSSVRDSGSQCVGGRRWLLLESWPPWLALMRGMRTLGRSVVTVIGGCACSVVPRSGRRMVRWASLMWCSWCAIARWVVRPWLAAAVGAGRPEGEAAAIGTAPHVGGHAVLLTARTESRRLGGQ